MAVKDAVMKAPGLDGRRTKSLASFFLTGLNFRGMRYISWLYF